MSTDSDILLCNAYLLTYSSWEFLLSFNEQGANRRSRQPGIGLGCMVWGFDQVLQRGLGLGALGLEFLDWHQYPKPFKPYKPYKP